ncbi:hypothetical protein YC2023_050010 [Brassica napus]
MLDWDPKGVLGPKTPLPDVVIIHAPKEEDVSSAPAQVAAPAAFYQKHPSQPETKIVTRLKFTTL